VRLFVGVFSLCTAVWIIARILGTDNFWAKLAITAVLATAVGLLLRLVRRLHQ
jgi:hypothetical protein